jgi:hypothetical protein
MAWQISSGDPTPGMMKSAAWPVEPPKHDRLAGVAIRLSEGRRRDQAALAGLQIGLPVVARSVADVRDVRFDLVERRRREASAHRQND